MVDCWTGVEVSAVASLSLVSLLGVDPDPVLPSVTYTAREEFHYT